MRFGYRTWYPMAGEVLSPCQSASPRELPERVCMAHGRHHGLKMPWGREDTYLWLGLLMYIVSGQLYNRSFVGMPVMVSAASVVRVSSGDIRATDERQHTDEASCHFLPLLFIVLRCGAI